jgi:hypothetical protein
MREGFHRASREWTRVLTEDADMNPQVGTTPDAAQVAGRTGGQEMVITAQGHDQIGPSEAAPSLGKATAAIWSLAFLGANSL